MRELGSKRGLLDRMARVLWQIAARKVTEEIRGRSFSPGCFLRVKSRKANL
jgi:hypothetical protein